MTSVSVKTVEYLHLFMLSSFLDVVLAARQSNVDEECASLASVAWILSSSEGEDVPVSQLFLIRRASDPHNPSFEQVPLDTPCWGSCSYWMKTQRLCIAPYLENLVSVRKPHGMSVLIGFGGGFVFLIAIGIPLGSSHLECAEHNTSCVAFWRDNFFGRIAHAWGSNGSMLQHRERSSSHHVSPEPVSKLRPDVLSGGVPCQLFCAGRGHRFTIVRPATHPLYNYAFADAGSGSMFEAICVLRPYGVIFEEAEGFDMKPEDEQHTQLDFFCEEVESEVKYPEFPGEPLLPREDCCAVSTSPDQCIKVKRPRQLVQSSMHSMYSVFMTSLS